MSQTRPAPERTQTKTTEIKGSSEGRSGTIFAPPTSVPPSAGKRRDMGQGVGVGKKPDLSDDWDEVARFLGISIERIKAGLLGRDPEISVVIKPVDDLMADVKLVWPTSLYNNVSRHLAKVAKSEGRSAKTPVDWISEILAMSPSDEELSELVYDNVRRVGCVDPGDNIETLELRPKIPAHVVQQLQDFAKQCRENGIKGIKRTTLITALVLFRLSKYESPAPKPAPER